MKKLTIILALTALLCACSTTKKASELNYSGNAQITLIDSVKTVITSLVDTTKSANQEITYTKIEFFEPVEKDSLTQTISYSDTAIISMQGTIKSIEHLKTVLKYENKGISEALSENESVSKESGIVQNDLMQKEDKTMAPARHYLRWIIIIAIVGIGVFAYLKRNTLVSLAVKAVKIIKTWLKIM